MATVPVRTLALVFGVAAAVASIVTIGVVLAGEVAVVQGLLLVVGFVLTAAVALLGALIVELKRYTAVVGARHTRQLSELHQTLRGALAVQADATRVQGNQLSAVQQRLDASPTAKRLDELGVQVAADTAQTYWQVEALLDLRTMLQPRTLMPPLRDWAASPDVLRWLAEYVLSRRPELIVECGSGASSLVLGYAVQKAGRGRVVALEHDMAYAEVTQRRVADHGLQDVVEVRHAPLGPWAGPDDRDWSWYGPAAVKDLDRIGLVFVDGPPAATGKHARYPALPVLLPHCADEVTFVLDDTVREDEVEVSTRWMQEHPEFVRQQLRADKGMHVLTRRSGPSTV